MHRLPCLLLMLVLAASPCAAAEPPAGIGILGPTDHRVPQEPDAWPWSSIGRVNHAGESFCTGTLIGPRAVLTAAHCLYDKRAKRWLKPHEVHFVAGYARGAFRAHGVGERLVRDPEGPTDRPPEGRDLARDWAIIVLREPMTLKPVAVAAVAPDALAAGELVRAGYGRDRPHLLAMHRGCRIVGVTKPPSVMLHQCDSAPGDSGSALLLFRDGVPAIIGVHVAILSRPGERVGAAVPAAAFEAALTKN